MSVPRLLGTICLLPVMLPAKAESLVVYYEFRPPYTEFKDGVLTGLQGKPAMQALQQLGITLDLRDVPFNRHMAIIEKNLEYACAVGRFKTAARMSSGKFSLPFYRDQPYAALVRGDNPKLQGVQGFQALLQTPGLRFVFREGYSYGEQLDGWIASSKATIVRLPESNLNLARMIYRQMADVSLFAGEEADGLLAALPEERGALAVRRYADSPQGALRYFYCSKQVDDALLHKLDAVIVSLKLGG
ncbi:hypothetical protein [Chitinimonas naiadis]